MSISVLEFIQKYNGTRIDDDGGYGVQCVDGKRVADRELGIPPYVTGTGYASGYWYNREEKSQYYDFIEGSENFRNGDEVVFREGTWLHPDSHVAIYYEGMSFGENQGGNGGFCLRSDDFSLALGALRPKGPYAWSDYSKPPVINPQDYAVFRLYNPNTGEHFFTANNTEANWIQDCGWTYEGIEFKHAGTEGIPLYRLYNPNAGDHMYTTDWNERQNLINNGWISEGSCFNVRPSSGVAVYRSYNPNTGRHVFTHNYNEFAHLVSLGWKGEGIAFYAD